MICRRQFAAAAAAMLPIPTLAQTDVWPNRPIRFISPFPPGGAADLLTRIMADELRNPLQQSTLVENRSGVGGAVGSEFVARSAPDGYTWLLASTGPFAITPELVRLTFEPSRDLAPVAMVAGVPSVFAVHPSVPANNMAELIALARAQPGRLSYASGGTGSATHLFVELLKQMAGLDILHVPYRGSGPSITDTVAGRVQFLCDTLPASLGHIREGRLRAVGMTTAARHPALPDVPTVAESGVPGYEAVGWYGMAAPAATPPALIARMNAEVNRLLTQPALRERLAGLGADPLPMTPAAFGAFIAEDRARWGRVIRDGNIRPD
jgi:tripartite-type tricarboxylate transporter receptor subunit TctC